MMIRPSKPWRPANCHDIYKTLKRPTNGIYEIYLNPSSLTPTKVYCEMEMGGWTRIFNSISLNSSFDKTWSEYKAGFGELEANHWLGLTQMSLLTYQQPMSLRIELSNNVSDRDFMIYDSFLIHSEKENFKISLGRFSSGTLPIERFLSYHNEMEFSTWDKDSSYGKCAQTIRAGWWFNQCYHFCATSSRNSLPQYNPYYASYGSSFTHPDYDRRWNFIKMMVRPEKSN